MCTIWNLGRSILPAHGSFGSCLPLDALIWRYRLFFLPPLPIMTQRKHEAGTAYLDRSHRIAGFLIAGLSFPGYTIQIFGSRVCSPHNIVLRYLIQYSLLISNTVHTSRSPPPFPPILSITFCTSTGNSIPTLLAVSRIRDSSLIFMPGL